MRIVALETTGRTGSVAALSSDELLAEVDLDPAQRSAQSLAPALDRLLVQVGWQTPDIQLVAVTQGPGSFTGLRVGVTAAKTLAYVAGCAIVGVNSLEVIARQYPLPAEQIAAVMDAQRQELFVAEFSGQGSDLRLVRPTTIVAGDAWVASLQPNVRVIGPGLRHYVENLPAGVSVGPSEHWAPRAAMVGRIGWEMYGRGELSDVWKLVPLYLRRSAAEEQWEAQGRV